MEIIKNEETRFFEVSKKQLKNFKKQAIKYGLTKTPLDEEIEETVLKLTGFKTIENLLNSNQEKQIKEKLKKVENIKFIFSSFSGVGKSVLTYVLHKITGKKIISADLEIEMLIAKEIEEGQLQNRQEFLDTLNKNPKEEGSKYSKYSNYEEWKIEKTKEIILKASERETLLDVGGRDPCKPEIVKFLKEKDYKIAYIDVSKKELITFKEELLTRSNFKGIYDKNGEGENGKKAVEKELEKIYEQCINAYKKSKNFEFPRVEGEILKTLNNFCNDLNLHLYTYPFIEFIKAKKEKDENTLEKASKDI